MKMVEVPSYFSFHVHKSTLECLFGSIKSGQRPTYQLSTTDLSGFIGKQAPSPRDSYLKRGPSVKTLWRDTRMMVFHMRLTVHFAILAPQYWCVNPSHQKTEKLGVVLHRFGKFWFLNYKKSSLAEMLKALSSFPPMMPVRKFSARARAVV